eukprot:290892-Amphidinium_carterae.1
MELAKHTRRTNSKGRLLPTAGLSDDNHRIEHIEHLLHCVYYKYIDRASRAIEHDLNEACLQGLLFHLYELDDSQHFNVRTSTYRTSQG